MLKHVHLHDAMQSRNAERSTGAVRDQLRDAGFSRELVLATVRAMAQAGRQARLAARRRRTGATTADTCSYTDDDRAAKAAFVDAALAGADRLDLVLDLGANDGVYSRLAAEQAAYVVAVEADPAVVDVLYRDLRKEGNRTILPLVMDLADPSPGGGWARRRAGRRSPSAAAGADAVLALALVHHLAIGRNVPLPEVVDWLAGHAPAWSWWSSCTPRTRWRSRLLANKPAGLFPDYHRDAFETAARGAVAPSRGGRSCRRAPARSTPGSGVTDGSDAARPSERARGGWARRPRLPGDRLLEILALCGLRSPSRCWTCTGRSPDFFLFYGADRLEILLLVAIVALVPAAGAVGDRRAGRPGRPAGPGAIAHTAMVGLLVAALAVQVGKHMLAAARAYRCAAGRARSAPAARTRYLRWRVPGPAAAARRGRPGGLRGAVRARLAGLGRGAAPTRRRRSGRRRPGSASHPPVVMLMLDEFPTGLACSAPDGQDRRRAVPELRRAGRRLHLVPQRHRGERLDPVRACRRCSPAATRSEEVAPHYSPYPDNLFTAASAACTTSDVAGEHHPSCARPAECDRARRDRGGLAGAAATRPPGCSARSPRRATSRPATRRTPTGSRPAPRPAGRVRCRPTRSSAGTRSTTTSRPGSPRSWPG